MRRAAELPLATALAGMLAILAAVAWVHLGPLVPIAVALPILGVILLAQRSEATILLLPLCLIPFAVRVGGTLVSASDLLVVGLSCCLLVAATVGPAPQGFTNPLTIPAIAFVIWTLASAVWAAEPAKAMVEAAQRLEFTVLGVALMAALPTDGRHTRRAVGGLAVGAAALGIGTVIIGMLEHRYIGIYPLGIHKNAAGSLLSYGLIAALGLRLAVVRRNRGRWLAVAGLASLVGMIVTGSRGAWIGTFIAFAAIVAIRCPRLVWPVTSVTLVAVTLFLLVLPPETLGQEAGFDEKYSTASVRAETWEEGIRAIAAHPVLGVGAGNFVARFSGTSLQSDPNNLFLLTWAETGLPGLALLVWFLAVCFRLAWQNARTSPGPGIAAATNLVGVAMLVTAVVHAQFDLFWSRGTGLAAFLGAGLVVWANRATAGTMQPRLPSPSLSAPA